jgi:hypothetical protein
MNIKRSGFRVQDSVKGRLRLHNTIFMVLFLFIPVLYCYPACTAELSDTNQGLQWQTPSAENVKTKAIEWLKEKNADAALQARAEDIWAKIPGQLQEDELLRRLAATFALADENAAKLTALCSRPRKDLTLPDQAWLGNGHTPQFLANNMRLYYARWLTQQSLYEEARDQLSGLAPADVVAPATLLFYQSVVHCKLLEKEPGLKTLGQLISGESHCPQRYIALARMMQADLDGLEEDSLDHIARRMEDVRRRLDLGRGGAKVRQVQDGVIASLDKLIKKLESAQQQQQSAASSSTLRPTRPAQDSVPMGGKGPGDVTRRDVGSQSDWGNLPQKERDEALQQIGRDLPAHYRDVIEQYFKKLAAEE